jgi:hypothetical protein
MWDTNVHFGENTKENTFRLFFNDYLLTNNVSYFKRVDNLRVISYKFFSDIKI